MVYYGVSDRLKYLLFDAPFCMFLVSVLTFFLLWTFTDNGAIMTKCLGTKGLYGKEGGLLMKSRQRWKGTDFFVRGVKTC